LKAQKAIKAIDYANVVAWLRHWKKKGGIEENGYRTLTGI